MINENNFKDLLLAEISEQYKNKILNSIDDGKITSFSYIFFLMWLDCTRLGWRLCVEEKQLIRLDVEYRQLSRQ